MINNVFEALKKNAYFFDTETTGLIHGQRAYEFSAIDTTGLRKSVYRGLSLAEMPLVSPFSMASVNQHMAGIKSGNIISSPNFAQEIAGYMQSQSQAGKFAVAHNINFDLSVVGEELKRSDPTGASFQKVKSLFGQAGPEDMGASILPGRGARATQRFAGFAHSLATAHGKGLTGAVDSLHLAQMFIGMGYERGIIGKAGAAADQFTGSNLRFLQTAFNVKSQGAAHVGSVDVTTLKELFPKIIDSSLQLYHGKNISDETVTALKLVEKYQKQMADVNLRAGILEHAYSWNRFDYPEIANLVSEMPGQYPGLDPKYIAQGHYALQTEKGYRRLPKIGPGANDEMAWLSLRKYGQDGMYQSTYGYSKKDFIDMYGQYSSDIQRRMSLPAGDPEADIASFIGNFKSAEEQRVLQAMGAEDRGALLAGFKKAPPAGFKGTAAPQAGAIADAATPLTSRTKWGMAIAGAGLFALVAANMFSGRDDDYNVIEGMRHEGVMGKQRKGNTDFGSGYQGIFGRGMEIAGSIAGLLTPSKLAKIGSSAVRGLKEEVRAKPAWALGFGVFGAYRGWKEGKEKGKISVGGFVGNMAIDMADDALIFAAHDIGKELPFLEKAVPYLESNIARTAGVSFFGYTVGKILGETAAVISGKDDAYNTIEGLRHTGIGGATRRYNTDFGSGYQGLNNLSPSYNTARDIYSYEQIRASKIGLSESELYRELTQENNSSTSQYGQASADAGTALHQLIQSKRFASGEIRDAETLVYGDGVSGHIDVISDLGIGDIKTVNSGIFKTIQKQGPKPSHLAQVQYYLGATGGEQGYIEYVNRDNPKQSKLFMVDFNAQKYQNLIKKTERVKFRVQRDLASGVLDKDDLPKTASLERLREHDISRETPEEQANKILENTLAFNQQMDNLRSIKRGMPGQGTAGYDRIQQRNKKRRRDAFFQSTQGIGLQLNNDRIGHHMM